MEELRKILIALWRGTKAAISPESLFTVIWKVVPRFRYASHNSSYANVVGRSVYSPLFFLVVLCVF